MRIAYKAFPLSALHPAFPSENTIWRPTLNVVISHGNVQSQRIEALVDSGADRCLFDASIGEALGIEVRKGIEMPIGGVIGGSIGRIYYHNVRLSVVGELIEITAGFSYELSFQALLGRNGFFDNFIVTFDHTTHPPSFETHRIHPT